MRRWGEPSGRTAKVAQEQGEESSENKRASELLNVRKSHGDAIRRRASRAAPLSSSSVAMGY